MLRMETLDEVPDSWKECVDRILEYHGDAFEYRNGGLLHGARHVNHYAKRKVERDLRKLGFQGIEGAVNKSQKERDEAMERVLALMMYREEKIIDPIERDYQYEELAEEGDEEPLERAREQIARWRKQEELKSLKSMIDSNTFESGDWEKGTEIRREAPDAPSSKERVQSLIGYWLFWRPEDREYDYGTIEPEFREQLNGGEMDARLNKMLKDLGKGFYRGVEISKLDDNKWELSEEDGNPCSWREERYLIEDEGDRLRFYREEKPAKRLTPKELILEVQKEKAEQLEFLKDFEGSRENVRWKEGDGKTTISVDFLDSEYDPEMCENGVKKSLRLYDLGYLDGSIKDVRIKKR